MNSQPEAPLPTSKAKLTRLLEEGDCTLLRYIFAFAFHSFLFLTRSPKQVPSPCTEMAYPVVKNHAKSALLHAGATFVIIHGAAGFVIKAR